MSDHDQRQKTSAAPAETDSKNNRGERTPAVSADSVLDRRAKDAINTRWFVDYHAVSGRQKGAPDRKQSDQLVVDSLKIRQPGEIRSTILKGGNLADSGDTFIGEAKLKPGPGTVSAAFHYGTKSGLDVKVELDGKRPGDAASLKAAHADAMKWIDDVRADRGDYPAMSRELEAMLSDRFPGRTIHVTILPDKGKTQPGLAAADADYSTDGDSEFVVTIDPVVSRDRAQTQAYSSSAEDTTAESDQNGVKSDTDTQTTERIKKAESFISSFKTRITHSTEAAFKQVEEQLSSVSGGHAHTVEGHSDWSGGIDPAKEESTKGLGAKQPRDGGKVEKLTRAVEKVGRWFWSKSKALPIVKQGLELASDLWNQVKVRGWVEHETGSKDSDTHNVAWSGSQKKGTEISSLSTFATEFAGEITTQTQSEVEKLVAQRFGLEVSQVHKSDQSKRTNKSQTITTSRVEAEASKPVLTIRKRA